MFSAYSGLPEICYRGYCSGTARGRLSTAFWTPQSSLQIALLTCLQFHERFDKRIRVMSRTEEQEHSVRAQQGKDFHFPAKEKYSPAREKAVGQVHGGPEHFQEPVPRQKVKTVATLKTEQQLPARGEETRGLMIARSPDPPLRGSCLYQDQACRTVIFSYFEALCPLCWLLTSHLFWELSRKVTIAKKKKKKSRCT